MENYIDDHDDIFKPLLQPPKPDDLIIDIELGNVDNEDENEIVSGLYNKIKADNNKNNDDDHNNDNNDDNDDSFTPEMITSQMFHFDMFSFTLTNDVIVYWIPLEHPIAQFLDIKGVPPLSYIKPTVYGDVVVHYGESLKWCVDLLLVLIKDKYGKK